MLLLRNDPLIENIKSDYIKIEKLMLEMKEKKLTGFFEVNLGKFSDILIYNSGKVVKVLQINSNFRTINKDKVVLDLVKSEAVFSAYRMKESYLKALLFSIENVPLYKNLSSDFVDIRKLLKKLEKDKFSGVIYVRWNKRSEGIILMDSGSPKASAYMEEKIVMEGAEALETIILETERKMADIDVITDRKSSF
ncbi:MAG: hypothetical protein J7J21_06900 [Methanomicrobia archaeon]|nr:hypothetical protein [Methanomicrobia archaeon]